MLKIYVASASTSTTTTVNYSLPKTQITCRTQNQHMWSRRACKLWRVANYLLNGDETSIYIDPAVIATYDQIIGSLQFKV